MLVLLISYGRIGTELSLYVNNLILKGGGWLLELASKTDLFWLEKFCSDVIIGAVGTVIVYLPQLALMLTLLFYPLIFLFSVLIIISCIKIVYRRTGRRL